MPRPSAREQILDAYEMILIDEGPGAVTLDAVAGRAAVSKGGLLYHFASKDALRDGLVDRLDAFSEEDIASAHAAPDGIVRYYLRTSVTDLTADEAFHHSLIAALRLVSDDARVREALRAHLDTWRELLQAEIKDPLAAELVTLVGDGIYLRTLSGGDPGPVLDNLDALIARLYGTSRRARR